MRRLGRTGDGRVVIVEEPAPGITPRKALVRTHFAALSAGTETRLILERRRHPVTVDPPEPFGYSNAGVVVEAGAEVTRVRPGEAVACYGGPYVRHAEFNAVPRHLLSPLPEGVELRQAAFGGIGTIAVHIARRGGYALAEKVLVVGQGILGNLTAQVLAAAGVDVLASELVPFRRRKAAEVGIRTVDPAAVDLEEEVRSWTEGVGLDGAVVLVSAQDPALLDTVLGLCRERARVLIAGGGGTGFAREIAFRKELEIIYPRAGGPGRYDPFYEEEGHDYPVGFVRWTEGRNLAAWLWLLHTGRVRVGPLVTHELPLEAAAQAFELLIEEPDRALGVLLRFPAAEE